VRIEGAARLTRADAQVPVMDGAGHHAREDGIAILARRSHQCGAGYCRHATTLAQEIEHVDARPAQRDLLERNGIGIELIDNLRDAFEIELSVTADAQVNIVGSEANFQRPVFAAAGWNLASGL
jgi:hypothetical protein